MSQPDKTDKNHNKWVKSCFFEKLSDAYCKFYNLNIWLWRKLLCSPKEELFSSNTYISEKHKCFGINIYKLCNMTAYT
jgi:hypothetical protein